MNRLLFLVVALGFSVVNVLSQAKPTLVVNAFTTAPDVELPYDMKLMQAQLVAELKVLLGKEFNVAAECPASPEGAVFTLDGEITHGSEIQGLLPGRAVDSGPHGGGTEEAEKHGSCRGEG